MNRISKRVIAFLLTLVLMLSLCACAQMAQLWAGTDEPNISVDSETPPGKPDKKPPEKPRPGAGGSDVQPAQAGFSAEAEQSLIWLRDRIDFPQTMFGAAYLGYVEEDSRGDWLSAADQAMLEAYPFLAEIDENHIIGSTGHLYCIVPVDENATVAINRVQWNENTYTYENTEVCYRSESGEPVLFFANLNGVAYEADTQVWITDNSGNSCEWYPSLDSMSYLWPCISETGDGGALLPNLRHGWQTAGAESTPLDLRAAGRCRQRHGIRAALQIITCGSSLRMKRAEVSDWIGSTRARISLKRCGAVTGRSHPSWTVQAM